jgi:hypothetical protein
MRSMNKALILFFLLVSPTLWGQIKLAKVKYSGGGDWYANKTSLPNLINFCNSNLPLKLSNTPETVELSSKQLFNYPYIHLTGHGNVVFNDSEIQNLKTYLLGGGFLHIDDNYGMDVYIRREMKKVFPSLEFVELPFTHPIYHQTYNFPTGIPKIHEHDGKPAQGFGLIYKGRLICFYSYESDLGNGWEDVGTYSDPVEKHQEALKMGANIIQFAFNNP